MNEADLNPAEFETRHASGAGAPIVRWLLAGLFLTVAASLLALYINLNQRQWVEVLGKDVVRTNAPSKLVAAATHEVIQRHQNYIEQEDGKKSDPSYRGGAKSWSAGPSKDDIRVKVTRGKTEIVDANGHSLAIERITVTDAPSLIFVEFSDPNGPLTIVNEILKELRQRGVEVR